MELILVRHAAVATPANLCYGQSDVALAAPAHHEVQRLSARLTPLRAERAIRMFSSPLARCAQIAAPLAAQLGAVLHYDVRLQELDFGRWELQRWDDVPRAELDAWAADLEQARPHGGESVAQLAARAGQWLAELERDTGRSSADAADAADAAAPLAVVVTHAGVMRVLAALALRVPLAATLDWSLAMGAQCHLRRRPAASGPSAGWSLVSWNG